MLSRKLTCNVTEHSGCLVVKLTTTPSRNLVQVLVAFEGTTLYGLTRTHRSPSSRAVTPAASRTASASASHGSGHTTIHPPAGVWTPVIWPGPAVEAVAHGSAPADRASATLVAAGRMPPRGSANGRSAHHVRREHGHWEAGEVHHAVHGIVLKVKSSRGPRWLLAIRGREVTVRISIRSRRCNVRGIHHVSIDQLELVPRVSLLVTRLNGLGAYLIL
jgi:hypothetical protein